MVLGIDLGTCNTLAATVSRDDSPVLIPDYNFKDSLVTPSIAFLEGNKAFVGQQAESYLDLYPGKNYIRYFKRFFGTNQPVFFDSNGGTWFSETVAAMILKKIRFDAEIALMEELESLVITVPAHYNDGQRKSVIEAARLANINLTAIIEEPVAAAISYCHTHNANDEIILVYDFGGGTFDLTLITKSGNNVFVLGKDGIPNLGGKEFDEVISQRIQEDYREAFGMSLDINPLNNNRLRKISEAIKLDLSCNPTNSITKWLAFGKCAFEFVLTADDFYTNTEKLIQSTETVINRCLRSIGLEFKDVNKILLVGGTSKIPYIRNYWNRKINPETQSVIFHEPMNSVAYGAALYANTLITKSGKINVPIELKSVSTYNIAIKQTNTQGKNNYDVLIHKNSPLPIIAKRIFKADPVKQEQLTIELCQFWDEDEVFQIGVFKINLANQFLSDVNLELTVENRANGTIGIKLKNGDNKKDVKFEFIKSTSEHKYDYQVQKNNLDNLLINNIY